MFGLVGATGTDLGLVSRFLCQVLATFDYETEIIRVIELLEAFKKWAELPGSPEEKRISERMDAGDDFRKQLGNGNALARLAMGRIMDLRAERTGDTKQPEGPRAYVLRILKRPEEVRFLREIYGANFFLVGAFAPRAERVLRLASVIATSHYSASSEAFRSQAESADPARPR